MEHLLTRANLATVIKTVLLFSFILLISILIWQAWPTIMLQTINWQGIINEQLSSLIYDAKDNPLRAVGYLSLLSIVYGALHSLGPGHGKMIVTTFLATHPSKVKHSLVLTIVSAIMQAVVAIVLVTTLVFLFDSSMRTVNSKALQLVNFSFLLMVALGAVIAWRAIKKLYQPISDQHNHHHGHFQCHGHKHMASADEINDAATWQAYLGIIVSIGMRPCTGAIMALLFAKIAGVYWLGVFSALMMALGTALTTSTIALMTLSGKQLINRYLHYNGQQTSSLSPLLRLLAGLLLIVLGLILFDSPSYGLSPIFN